MTYFRRIAPALALSAATALVACDDDANTTPTPDPDMMIVVDMMPEPEPDPDMAVDLDMAMPDMAPDMNVVDMEIDQEIDQEVDMEIDADTIVQPGPECMDNDGCDGAWTQCLDGQCQVDLRPDVFVVNTIRVIEPATSAGLIETFLGDAVDDNMLNLIIEGGGYNDMNEYLWYIGNGGFRAGEYDYLARYPVQNFWGWWRDDAENGLRWAPDEQSAFTLNVPTGVVQNAEGMDVSCISQIVTTVDITITPSEDMNGDPMVNAVVTGSLARADAERVQFRLPNGAVIMLVDLLDDADLNIDTDGDGTPDAYPFAFDADAAPVLFVGDPPAPDGSNRDPNPDFMNDPACN